MVNVSFLYLLPSVVYHDDYPEETTESNYEPIQNENSDIEVSEEYYDIKGK